MELLYKEHTERLIGGFFIVQNDVGLGRHEEAYHRAYRIWAESEGLPLLSKPGIPLFVAGREATVIYPDFVAWDQISIEVKALPRMLGASEDLQLFDYLRARGDRLGLLVNLGLDRVHVERRIYAPPETEIVEDWSYWTNHISGHDREIGAAIRDAFRQIYAGHRTGYSRAVTEKLVLTALVANGLEVVVRPVVRAVFRQQVVHESPLECFVIANRFVLTLTAQFDSNDFNTSLGLSCLKTLDLPWGIAANFGRQELQLTALRYKASY